MSDKPSGAPWDDLETRVAEWRVRQGLPPDPMAETLRRIACDLHERILRSIQDGSQQS